MELFPALRIGWLNGWLPMGVLYLIFGILLLVFPKEVVRRLYERSNWSREQRVIVLIGKLIALVWFPLIIFMPLKIGYPVFVLGMVLFALGLVGFVVALFNFRNTPLDRPVKRGLYRISRHPQQFMLLVSGLGISIAIGSWLALLMLLLGLVFTHRKILAEEGSCMRQYGDSYRAYMERVPRYSVSFQPYVDWPEQDRWDLVSQGLSEAAQKLEAAGADFIVIATNTMHLVFDQVQANVSVPMLSLLDAVGEAILARRMKTVGLLGTKLTMEKTFYQDALAPKGIVVLVPDKEDREYVNTVIYDELVAGQIRHESRAGFVAIIKRLAERGAEGVIPGCTEIPLLVNEGDVGLPLFDTIAIHAEVALNYALV